jgi:light-regulated signal transduction histidine kinase (bacteriophytochrome)
LDYSKINSAGKSFESTDMANVLAEVKQNLQSSIQETNASITIDTLPVLPANRQQMVQLFQHLLNNAIKFRSVLPLHIHISAIEQEEHYLFSVSDTGIGMEMKYTRKIFQVFQRLHSRDEYEGAGIGLAACKRIVERHNGNIWVESQPGQGSTFFFTLKKN